MEYVIPYWGMCDWLKETSKALKTLRRREKEFCGWQPLKRLKKWLDRIQRQLSEGVNEGQN